MTTLPSYQVWVPARMSLEARAISFNSIWKEVDILCLITMKYVLGDQEHIDYLVRAESPRVIGYIKFRETQATKVGKGRGSRSIRTLTNALIMPNEWRFFNSLEENWIGTRFKTIPVKPPWYYADEGPIVPPLGKPEEIHKFLFSEEV